VGFLVACGGGSTETSPKSTDGWKKINVDLGQIYPDIELQVPDNWEAETSTSEEHMEFDKNNNAVVFYGGRFGLTKEDDESIPKYEIVDFEIRGIWESMFKPGMPPKTVMNPLDPTPLEPIDLANRLAEYTAKFNADQTQVSVDGVAATKLRYIEKDGNDDLVIVSLLVVSSDDPRTLCGAFGFSISGVTHLVNEAAIDEVIDTIKILNPETQIFRSCDDPAGDYLAFLDSLLPNADIYISDLKIKPCYGDMSYTDATAKITNKGDSTTYGYVGVEFLTYTAGGERASSSVGSMAVQHLPPGETLSAHSYLECKQRSVSIEVIGVSSSGKDLTFFPSGPALKSGN